MSVPERPVSSEREHATYRALENPAVYRLSQILLAPGFKRPFVSAIDALAASLPRPRRILDVGCGPDSWVAGVGDELVGVDTQLSYLQVLRSSGHGAAAASAVQLPFATASFNAVWSFSLLHHLTDAAARIAVAEMLRVCRPDGHVVI